jgi:hypothetical protein
LGKGDKAGGNAPGVEQKPDGAPVEPGKMTRCEAADYIASLLEGLKAVANTAGLPFIAYLLSVTIEAAQEEKVRKD